MQRPPFFRTTLAIPFASLLFLASFVAGAAEPPKVVASVKPVQSLVAAVMQGVAEPRLLVKGANNPHSYAMRPSDARALAEAGLIFWVGDGLETFLIEPLEALAGDATVVALKDAPGIRLLAPREGGLWEPHIDEGEGHDAEHPEAEGEDHAEEGEGHEHEHAEAGYDGHIWLDPENAKAIVAAAVTALIARDPANAAIYRTNGENALARLDALNREIAEQVAPVRRFRYIVFHDAYQYFEKRYGLSPVGSITVHPERQPGARRIKEIHERIVDLEARCVFSEPQFEPALVETVIAGTDARRGVLDPEGAAIPDGPDLYFTLLRTLAGSLVACLGG